MKSKLDEKKQKLKELEKWRGKLKNGMEDKGASVPVGMPKTLQQC